MLNNVKDPNQFVLQVATGVYGSPEPPVTVRGNKTSLGWQVQVERGTAGGPGVAPQPPTKAMLHLSGAWAQDVARTLADTRLRTPERMAGAPTVRVSLEKAAPPQEPSNAAAWRELADALVERARNRPTAPLRFVHVTAAGRTELRIEHDGRERRARLVGTRDGKEVRRQELPLAVYKALKLCVGDLRMNREGDGASDPPAPGVYLDVGDGVLRSWHDEVGGNFHAMQLRKQIQTIEPQGFGWGADATIE
jgi:hypothetical protein